MATARLPRCCPRFFQRTTSIPTAAPGPTTTTTAISIWSKGISNPFGGPTQLYRNNHNGTFANVTTASIGNVGPGANNVVWGDYDNDGFVDLFMAVGYNAPDNILLHNRGDGTFSRVTGNPWSPRQESQEARPGVITTTMAGWISSSRVRLLAACSITMKAEARFDRSQIKSSAWIQMPPEFRGEIMTTMGSSICSSLISSRLIGSIVTIGDGSFTLLTNSVIYQMTGPSSGGAWADYDNDGWLDLFVANYRGNSFLFHNDGKGGFTSVAGAVTEYGTGQGAGLG
jgi:hypothetical protein